MAANTGRCCSCCQRAPVHACQQGARRPWTGFLHAGGVLADALVPKQAAGGVRKVFGPKVTQCLLACSHMPAAWPGKRGHNQCCGAAGACAAQLPACAGLPPSVARPPVLLHLSGCGQRWPVQLCRGQCCAGRPGPAESCAGECVGSCHAHLGLRGTAPEHARTGLQGLMGTATGWGPWAVAGMAAQDPALLQRLKRQGGSALIDAHAWTLAQAHAVLVSNLCTCRLGGNGSPGRPASAARHTGVGQHRQLHQLAELAQGAC